MAKADIFTLITVGGYKVKVSVPEDEVEMQPGRERTVTAQLYEADGETKAEKAGEKITLSVTGVPNSGGHIDAYHTIKPRPTGKFTYKGVENQILLKDIETDENGTVGVKYPITYKAPVFGGEEEITASITGDTDTVPVINRIPGTLVPLPTSPHFYLIGGSGGDSAEGTYNCAHPSNHWGAPNTLAAIVTLALYYQKEFGKTLHINDISLWLGGKFDCVSSTPTQPECKTANWSGGHLGHRFGQNVDIRAKEDIPPGKHQDYFERFVKIELKGAFKLEFEGEPEEHYHCTFP